jgi:hypothetical protein
MRSTFTIEEVDTKQSSRGPFKRAKLSGIGWVSVFAEGDQDFLEENLGGSASAEIVTNDKGFKNASAFQGVTLGDFQKTSGAPSQPAGGNGMTPEAWDKKEDRQAVGINHAVHIKQMIEWKTRFPHAPDAISWETYDDVVMAARKKAVRDLDWRRNYATGDVPFA